MRLEKPGPGDDTFTLTMSPEEWAEIYALAKFAQVVLAYDCQAAYVAQVFTYLFLVGRFGMSQPCDIQADPHMQSAFAAIDRLGLAASGDVVLALRKAEMLQLVNILGKASEAEDKADLLHPEFPKEFPYVYPDLQFPCADYADLFEAMLRAISEDRSLTFRLVLGVGE